MGKNIQNIPDRGYAFHHAGGEGRGMVVQNIY